MSNYIEIRNKNNIVTINDNYKNLSFVKKQNGNEVINGDSFIEIDSRIGVAAIAASSPNIKICRPDTCWVRVKKGRWKFSRASAKSSKWDRRKK